MTATTAPHTKNNNVSNSSVDIGISRPDDAKMEIADLVADFGSSSATAWLEFERYKIWRPSPPTLIPQSSFPPVQGYMRQDPFVFGWGNPLVSDKTALKPTAIAFIEWVKYQGLKPIWCCVDYDLKEVLGGEGSDLGWSTVHCIYEDVVDPANVVELTSSESKGQEGVHVVKDLKKNLRRAEKEEVEVKEVKAQEWTEQDKRTVEQGIQDWKKSRIGVQIASTTLQPWLDSAHRRYWIAQKDGEIVGLLILSSIYGTSYQIKNAISFPQAPKGTSEELIYTALEDLHRQDSGKGQVTVTFGITAADEIRPVDNLSGLKVAWMSKTYGMIANGAGLLRRGDFRSKFNSEHKPMFVCYPKDDGFGIDAVHSLMKLLRK